MLHKSTDEEDHQEEKQPNGMDQSKGNGLKIELKGSKQIKLLIVTYLCKQALFFPHRVF